MLINPDNTQLNSICSDLLPNWAEGDLLCADSSLNFENELKMLSEDFRNFISGLNSPSSSELAVAVRAIFLSNDKESSLARCSAACPVFGLL